jgi:hypothetical protein
VSAFLDELARALAEPMPRSRAIRVLGMTVASAAVPLLRPKPAAARYSRAFRPSCHTAHCPSGNPPDPDDPYTLLCKCNEKPTGSPIEPTMCNKICCDPCQHECECLPGAVRCKPKAGAVAGAVHCGSKCCGNNEYCANAARSKCCPDNPRKDYCDATDRGSGKYVDLCCVPGECCRDDGPLQAGKPKASCCPRERCCKGECCGPQQKCVNGSCKCKDPKKQQCGKDCCSKEKGKEQPCCDNQICCEHGRTCCGIDCCDPKTQKNCCQLGKGTKCCPVGLDCCGPTCCGSTETCLRGGPKPACCEFDQVFSGRCCPKGTVATKNGCCPPTSTHCCQGKKCAPLKPGFPTFCVEGKCAPL